MEQYIYQREGEATGGVDHNIYDTRYYFYVKEKNDDSSGGTRV